MGRASLKRAGAKIEPKASSEDQSLIQTLQAEHVVIDDSPMPSADELAKYKELDPRLVDYFMRITNEERAMRHEATKQSMDIIAKDSKGKHQERVLGLIFAFVSLLGFLGTTILALYLDKPWLAAIFSTLSIAGIVSAFVTGAKKSE